MPFRIVTALFFCLLITGCLPLGPDYQRPEIGLDIPGQYLTADSDGQLSSVGVTREQWWQEFDDTRLVQLVKNVLTRNPDIHRAAAAILEARALAAQVRADRFPSLNLSSQADRRKQSLLDPVSGNYLSQRTDVFSLSLPASFELDLWGRLARASEAARADLLAAEENRQTLVQSLIAEAITRYFTVQSLEEQLRITRQLTRTHQENLALVEARYRRGLTSVLDIRQARRTLARSRAEIPSLLQQLETTRQALAILQGQYPENATASTVPKTGYAIPPPVPTGLPAELLQRRPDIRAAEASLAAACARIGAAKANRFPHISLTGNFGYTSDELDLLLEPESELWNIAAGIIQPLFDAGKRKAAQKATEARYQQQLANYARTVLAAFAEVEGALTTREQQIERYRRLEIFFTEAKATLTTALDRYQRGLAEYLQVLDAQQAKYQAELSLVQTRYAILTNRVALYRALGGGWGNIAKPTGKSS